MTGAPATCRQVTAWEGAGSDIAAQPPSLDPGEPGPWQSLP